TTSTSTSSSKRIKSLIEPSKSTRKRYRNSKKTSSSSSTSSNQPLPPISILIEDPINPSITYRLPTSPLQNEITYYVLTGHDYYIPSSPSSLTGSDFDSNVSDSESVCSAASWSPSSGSSSNGSWGSRNRSRSISPTPPSSHSSSASSTSTYHSTTSSSLLSPPSSSSRSRSGNGRRLPLTNTDSEEISLLAEAKQKLNQEISAEESLRIVMALAASTKKGRLNAIINDESKGRSRRASFSESTATAESEEFKGLVKSSKSKSATDVPSLAFGSGGGSGKVVKPVCPSDGGDVVVGGVGVDKSVRKGFLKGHLMA
ncbi:hypothetical protein HDU76_006228, partial [Blyttiomyces sp. JEL0837]